MKYTDDFKRKVFKVCRFMPIYAPIMKALEENSHNSLRIMLEDVVDDDLLYTEHIEDDEVVRLVREDKKYAHLARVNLYSEFMDMYTTQLDDARILREDRLHL